jgi:gas vesicle protein
MAGFMQRLKNKVIIKTKKMKARNILIGFASTLVAGIALGLLFAPRKGSKTRKMIGDMKEEMADTIKSSINQAWDAISNAKEETKDAARKVANKANTMANEARSSN